MSVSCAMCGKECSEEEMVGDYCLDCASIMGDGDV